MSAKYLDIKMATVMEEDFENEQLNITADNYFVGEKFAEMDITNRLNKEKPSQNSEEEDSDDDDRPSSIIEKDVGDFTFDINVIDAVCKQRSGSTSDTSKCDTSEDTHSIEKSTGISDNIQKTSESKQNYIDTVPPKCINKQSVPDSSNIMEPIPDTSNLVKPVPDTTTGGTRRSPSTTPPASPTEKEPRLQRNSRKSSSLMSQPKSITFTLSVRDKFVTELSFHHPFSLSRFKLVNLGIFLATSRNFGDHFVYKISPLSPLRTLNLQPQDRIIQLNNFDITSWSHNSVINFVRHLPQNDQNRFVNLGKTIKFTFSMDYISVNRPSTSPQQGPSRFSATLEVIMQPNGRTSIGATTVSPISVRYLNRTACTLLKLGSTSNRYIKVEEVTANGETLLNVTEGEKTLGESNANIIFHEFDMTYTRGPRQEAGKIVAMETFRSGTFLHVGNATAGSDLSLITDSAGIQNINTTDSRLFRIYSDEGNILSKIVNIQSGLYLKAENGRVSLEDPPVTSTMLFRTFPC